MDCGADAIPAGGFHGPARPSDGVLAEIQSVAADSGELVQNYQTGVTPTARKRRFNSFPANAQFLRVTASVQKMRTVEFLVKPPNAK